MPNEKKLNNMLACQINRCLKHFTTGLLCLALVGCIGSSPTRDNEAAAQAAANPRLAAEFNHAVSVLKSGNRKRAFSMFTKIAKKYPDSSGAHVNIGLAYLGSHKLDRAEKAFNNAIKINTKNAVAHNGLGIIFRQQGKFKQAEQEYLTALSIDNTYANAHLNIGILQDIYFDNPGKALQYYQEYMKHSSKKDSKVEKWIIEVQRRSTAPRAGGPKG